VGRRRTEALGLPRRQGDELSDTSANEFQILATAWEPYQELLQSVITCLHFDFRIGGLASMQTGADVGALVSGRSAYFP
jgi:hypothetical protein